MLRRVNELSVLAVLRGGEPRVLREIADRTGLSWRTASVVTESLEAHGWIVGLAADATGKRPGRPARSYRFRAEIGHVVGIDIASYAVAVLVADLDGEIVGRHRVAVSPRDAAPERLAAVEATVRAALAAARLDPAGVWAATVGISGIVDPDGLVTKAPLLPGFEGIDLRTRLADILACPVAVANDANLAVLAERWRGHRADTAIHVMTGVRLGVGLVVGGQLHRGSTGAAGEIGHFRDFGWNDTAARLAAQAAGPSLDPDRAAAEVFAAARAGDAAALAAVDRFAADVARGLTAMVLTIDPDLVVLGGGFAHAADLLLPRLGRHLAQACPHLPRLEASGIGEDSVGLGAVRLALDSVEARIAALDGAVRLAPASIRHAAVGTPA